MNISNLYNDLFFIIFGKLNLSEINNLLRTSKQFINKKEDFKKYIDRRFPKRTQLQNWTCFESAINLGHFCIIKHLRKEYISWFQGWLNVSMNARNVSIHPHIRNSIFYRRNLEIYALDLASYFGHLDIVKYFHYLGGRCTVRAMDLAAKKGHLHVVKWLHENRSEGCSKNAIWLGVRNKHHHVVLWFFENKLSDWEKLSRITN